MTPRTKTAALIAGFALLAVIAVAGWTRNPSTTNVGANNFASPAGVYSAVNPTDPNRAMYGQPGYQPAYGQPAYSNVPVQSAAYDPAMNCAEPVYSNAAYAPASYNAPRYRTYNRPRVVRTRYVEDRDVVVRSSRRGRSTGKSVAIVAGSAAAGAGIGALAGGGKGAAIGALSGGAAGFLFDRLTHNR